jgi:hypothetical protein
MNDPETNKIITEVYQATNILRKPISGIVSGYHQLPYVLIAPDDEDTGRSIQINGKINVSPRFVISPTMLAETFGQVFDPETFSEDISARMFSFSYTRQKSLKIENQGFEVQNFEERAQEHLNRVQEDMMREENVRTGLIFGPRFGYYPVSIDRFVNEILDREFNL